MVKTTFDKSAAGDAFIQGLTPGAQPPKKKTTASNSKTEHVATDKLQPQKAETKAQKSSFENLSEFKSLTKLNNKGNRDTIYFHKKKGFLVEKRSNGFVEFLKAIFLVNVFKYNLFGYSSNDKKVYSGLKKLVSDLPAIEKKAESDADTKKLVETIAKTHTVLDVIRQQNERSGEDIDAGAIENLQRKIAEFIHSHSSSPLAISGPGLPPPPPPIAAPFKPIGQPAGQPNIGDVKLSPGTVQADREPPKPKLPALDTYEIPEVEVKANLGDFQLAQTKKRKRTDLLQNLNEYYQEFIEARNELIRLNQELEKVAAKIQPKQKQPQAVVVNDGVGGPPPPPPPPSSDKAPPPPPPPSSDKKPGGRPPLKKQMTFRERQLLQLKDFKVSPTVKLMEEIIKEEEKRDLAIENIKETLFPGISGLTFSTDEEIEALENYVKAYQAQAGNEIDQLQEIEDRTNPFNRSSRSSSPSRVDRDVDVQPKQSETVVKLKTMLGDIEKHQKAIASNEQKMKNYKLDMKQAKKDLSELSDKMALKKLAASYTASDKQKDYKAAAALSKKATDKKQDIATAKESIASLKQKIDGVRKVLAFEVHMDMSSELDAVIAKAKELIAEESQK